MRAINGFVIMVSGGAALAAFLVWTIGPVADDLLGSYSRGDVGALTNAASAFPDVYFAFVVPALLTVLVPTVFVGYGLFNMALAPGIDDISTVCDSHGAARRMAHGGYWKDLDRDTPFINDLNVAQTSQILHGR